MPLAHGNQALACIGLGEIENTKAALEPVRRPRAEMLPTEGATVSRLGARRAAERRSTFLAGRPGPLR